MTAEESEQYKGYKKVKLVPVSGYHYKGFNPNDGSNNVVDSVDYRVATLPNFQGIVGESDEKGNFGSWLSVRMSLGELPVIF